MTGRGIDQILPTPSKPHLFESFVGSALTYVELAERASGRIERPVDFAYIWGDALSELEHARPDARIVNLETAVTVSEDAWPAKGIHYRMHPANVSCLTAARLDCCVLANNHVMDWGRGGLSETLATLHGAGIRTAGAGRDAREAAAPAVVQATRASRVLIFAFGMHSSGVPDFWRATRKRPGISLLRDFSSRSVEAIARDIASHRRPGDIVVVSVHWGPNWGFDIPSAQREFAHALTDSAGVNVVHGHSSHHAKGIEVYHDKLILYGCGDFLNDYEGIGGYETYRGNLALMYFPVFDLDTGDLVSCSLSPTRTQRFRVTRAGPDDAGWLQAVLNREGAQFGTSVEQGPDGRFLLRWAR